MGTKGNNQRIGDKGLAVIQQRFDISTKSTWWSEIDQWLTDEIYINSDFKFYFDIHGGVCENGLPTTESGKEIGWSMWDDLYWIDFDHYISETEDGLKIYTIDMVFPPCIGFLEEAEI